MNYSKLKYFNATFYLKKIKLYSNELRKRFIGYPDIERRNLNYNNYWELRRYNNDEIILNSFRLFRANYCIKSFSNSSNILDLGSGDGLTILYIKNIRKDLNFLSSDMTFEICKSLKEKGLNVLNIDLTQENSLEQLEEYDYITAFEVFEHLSEPEKIILKLLDHTKMGLIFSVPNSGYLAYRIRLMLGKFPIQWKHHPGEHLRYWTLADMDWWLNKYLRISGECYEIIPYNAYYHIFDRIMPGLLSKGLLINVKKFNKKNHC